jgi:hypothetical protein
MKSADKHRIDKRQKTLAEHTRKQKDALLEELAKCPIVQVACERTSIGRATYYKWRTEDAEFRRIADKAVDEGRKFVNDIAESQMIRKIKEGNMTSIIYWLKNNNSRYTEKRTEEIEPLGVLPPDQAKELLRAMHLMGLTELIRRSDKLAKVFRESENETQVGGHSGKRKGVVLKEFFKHKEDE